MIIDACGVVWCGVVLVIIDLVKGLARLTLAGLIRLIPLIVTCDYYTNIILRFVFLYLKISYQFC